MMRKSAVALALCHILHALTVQAAVTWPSSIDHIEDLMMLQTGYGAQKFANLVTPCSNTIIPGYRAAAGFLRTAFSDVSSYDAANAAGGMDASIGFELQGTYAVHNDGPTFNSSLAYLYSFFNSQASMADLLALSVYASVRSCGGPQIPFKTGRIDATVAGPDSLPDRADSKEVLVGRFAKMGFTPQQMIQLVACGHTLGGVHSTTGTVQNFDTTPGNFDNIVVSQYVTGTTQNPLVVGPAALNSDSRVFGMDDPAVFQRVCQTVLQTMLEKVPRGVQLSDTITAYDVKPGKLNLDVIDGGMALLFSGEIRVKTTTEHVSSVSLIYQPRSGDTCDSCAITTTLLGTADGLDETFEFFGFSAQVPSITSFTVVVKKVSGAVTTYDNGGAGFPVNDAVFVQASASSYSGSSLKVIVAKRTSELGIPGTIVTTKSSWAFNNLPTLSSATQDMSLICSGPLYSFYTATMTLDPAQATSARLDITLGNTVVSAFRTINFASSGVVPTCPTVASSSTTSTTVSSTTALESISTDATSVEFSTATTVTVDSSSSTVADTTTTATDGSTSATISSDITTASSDFTISSSSSGTATSADTTVSTSSSIDASNESTTAGQATTTTTESSGISSPTSPVTSSSTSSRRPCGQRPSSD
ncbi:heme peroxidase [Xylariales sp. PMI_506]|nr:heme peroxidase [Xylariales sp. PMI_506]